MLLSLSNIYSEELLGNFSLKNISFTQESMEKIAVIGESGSGKTTLLKTIAGLLQPVSGTILFNNKVVRGPNWQLIPGEKGIGYLSQHFELLNNYRMEELLSYANELSDEEAQEIFSICRIDHLMKRNSYELSGGEKQRVALARILINKPQLLILDEPFSNLDLIHRKILKEVIERSCIQYNISSILCSHEPDDVLPWADKILVMQRGEIIQEGTSVEIYERPVSEYVAGLLGPYKAIRILMENKDDTDEIILRPGWHTFYDEKKEGKKWIIQSIKYKGSYSELEVKLEEQSMIVFTQREDLKIGDKINFEYS